MTSEPQFVKEARQALSTLVVKFDVIAEALTVRDGDATSLETRVIDLTRRVNEAEQRAILAEQRADSLATKAEKNDRVEAAATKLVEALDRLPLTMEQAGMVPGATRPAIALYGTYDWQAVMDAKFALLAATKPREE